ncbi:MAG: hypothetical protein H8E91_00460 [Planctomycetes bacterium]|nr:hypothetical protein [Planctomycetota bacterium]
MIEFALLSDDGYRQMIDGQIVIVNDDLDATLDLRMGVIGKKIQTIDSDSFAIAK